MDSAYSEAGMPVSSFSSDIIVLSLCAWDMAPGVLTAELAGGF